MPVARSRSTASRCAAPTSFCPAGAWNASITPDQWIPSVERLIVTVVAVANASIPIALIRKTSCFRSLATTVSLARRNGPLPSKTVRPGRLPNRQDRPEFWLVAQPMSEPPPLKKRPTWLLSTMIDPFVLAAMCGSCSTEVVRGGVGEVVLAHLDELTARLSRRQRRQHEERRQPGSDSEQPRVRSSTYLSPFLHLRATSCRRLAVSPPSLASTGERGDLARPARRR
jgi:hypothetical protein